MDRGQNNFVGIEHRPRASRHKKRRTTNIRRRGCKFGVDDARASKEGEKVGVNTSEKGVMVVADRGGGFGMTSILSAPSWTSGKHLVLRGSWRRLRG